VPTVLALAASKGKSYRRWQLGICHKTPTIIKARVFTAGYRNCPSLLSYKRFKEWWAITHYSSWIPAIHDIHIIIRPTWSYVVPLKILILLVKLIILFFGGLNFHSQKKKHEFCINYMAKQVVDFSKIRRSMKPEW